VQRAARPDKKTRIGDDAGFFLLPCFPACFLLLPTKKRGTAKPGDLRYCVWPSVPAAGALAPFFALGFFGFFLCSVIGGEYDDTLLAGCANAAEPDVNRMAAATAKTGVSFFMRLSP
jgi:hypothetical protein